MKMSGTYIPFDKEEYSVPEIAKIVAEYYGIRIEGDEKADRNYKAMTHLIRQKLQELDDGASKSENVSGQKSRYIKYPQKLVDIVVNTTLASHFANKAPGRQKRIYRDWALKAAQYNAEHESSQFQQTEQEYYETEFSEPPSEGKQLLYEAIKEYKLEILMDVIFNHFIELDEALLEHDVAIGLTFWGNNSPTGEDMQAIHNLDHPHTYYKLRKTSSDENG